MTETTSCRSPRLEPCLRLSPHTAQHLQIVLSFCSVTIGAEYLKILDTICILGIFEPDARFDVIHMDLAGMEWGASTFTVGAIHRTNSALVGKDFLPQIHLSVPVFIAAPEAFEYEQFFSYDGFSGGVGIMP